MNEEAIRPYRARERRSATVHSLPRGERVKRKLPLPEINSLNKYTLSEWPRRMPPHSTAGHITLSAGCTRIIGRIRNDTPPWYHLVVRTLYSIPQYHESLPSTLKAYLTLFVSMCILYIVVHRIHQVTEDVS